MNDMINASQAVHLCIKNVKKITSVISTYRIFIGKKRRILLRVVEGAE